MLLRAAPLAAFPHQTETLHNAEQRGSRSPLAASRSSRRRRCHRLAAAAADGVSMHASASDTWRSDTEWAAARGYSVDGLGVEQVDAGLKPFEGHLRARWARFVARKRELEKCEGGLEAFATGYTRYGLNARGDGSVELREWVPAAAGLALIGDFNGWNGASHRASRDAFGVWTLRLPAGALPHGSRYKLQLTRHDGGKVDRLSAWTRFATVAPGKMGAAYDGVHWAPPSSERHVWRHTAPPPPAAMRIYEAHVGMATSQPRVGSYREFADNVLPRVATGGYNTLQLMAVAEHAYYASFGYHVTNFFAVSSRSGNPEELKYLIDIAHGLGIRVLLDVVHSHASSNVDDGLAGLEAGSDGSAYLKGGAAGKHAAWGSRCFNYAAWETQRLLLSNLRFWMDEFKVDGFRFDGVTSMLYVHHGINKAFSGSYAEYFSPETDLDAVAYLMLANDLIHSLRPGAASIAEDVSGMPTLCRPIAEGGVGFDARLAMALPDHWIKLLKERPLPEWNVAQLVNLLCNRRYTEKTIAYVESHDQALVGDKTTAMWLMDQDMYDGMSTLRPATARVTRGMALHKTMRALTAVLGGDGYLTFMGNEFGHPEWVDFPREGNGWSHAHCLRRWDLVDTDHLRYGQLRSFDAALMGLEEARRWLSSPHQHVSMANDFDKLIVCERGDLLWVFSFSPDDKTGVDIPAPSVGYWKAVIDTEEGRFGGRATLGLDSRLVPALPGALRTWVGQYEQPPRAAVMRVDGIPACSARAYARAGELPPAGAPAGAPGTAAAPVPPSAAER